VISPRLLETIVCPRDKQRLQLHSGRLRCTNDHSYGILDGIPILLVGEADQTHIEGQRSLHVGETGDSSLLPSFDVAPGAIDPFVQQSVGATNGTLYRGLIGKLKQYPIPRLRLPHGGGSEFLEIGCSWGRWCIAAARCGYRPIGIDPSLKGVRAAQRIARQLGIDALYLVADGRYLPFPENRFDHVFSYSVLQHLSPADVRATLREVSRVLRGNGKCTVQMANAYGIRSLQHQLRREFREAIEFEVRYWSPSELKRVFAEEIGPCRLSTDGFFSLNPQISDIKFLPWKYRSVVYTSEMLRHLSAVIPALRHIADSVYVEAEKAADQCAAFAL
jgi:ubiquinone/menaquinone biosynthesis C-methylase UbiE/uncharacterized protein YbaR (Trm112 family)